MIAAAPNRKDEWIVQEVAKANPKLVLDIAYAHGPNLALSSVGATIVGIDPLGRKTPFSATHKLDVNVAPLPFKDGEVDAVVMGCVLAHLSNPLKFLAEVNRVLAPGGLLILSSPNPNYYWETIVNIFYHRFKNRVSKSKHIEHFFELTRYAMRTILERTGFTLEKEQGSTFQIVKTNIKLDVHSHPGLAFQIVYAAKKTGAPQAFTVIEDDAGAIIKLETDLFN